MPKELRITKATFSSRNFEFESYAKTKIEAEAIIVAGLITHARQCGIAENWFCVDDIGFLEISLGKCYRDNEILKTIIEA